MTYAKKKIQYSTHEKGGPPKEVIEETIKKLRHNKSPGSDNISTEIWVPDKQNTLEIIIHSLDWFGQRLSFCPGPFSSLINAI